MNLSRNDPCWCGSGQKWKKCHYPELGPNIEPSSARHYFKKWKILLKTPEQIAGIRRACRLTAWILQETCKQAKEGVTTEELNTIAHRLHIENKASPAPLGYGNPPYPKSICTSLNEVICHGIPDQRPLKKGDIVNIDVSAYFEGYFGDSSAMVMIGEVSEEKKRVVDVARESLYRSIAILKPGILLSAIGQTIEEYASSHNCSVVNQFVGHGIGVHFHEAPDVPHHYNDLQIPLVEGMTFTIEPMINAGVRTAVFDADGWTARTADGLPSAQWEHTILITRNGHEILTEWE